MSRLKSPLVILGVIGAAVVCVVVALAVSATQGTGVEVPVADVELAPGTLLEPGLFRLAEVRGLDTEGCVTAAEFGGYMGYPLIEPVHEGFPVGKAQVAMTDTLRYQDRLTLLLEDPANLVYPLPVDASQVGNYIYPGDHVDVIFTLGRVSAHDMTHSHVERVDLPGLESSEEMTGTAPTVTPTPMPMSEEGELVTTTLELPLSKVVLADVHVLQVEREQVRSTSPVGIGGESGASSRPVQGDVLRLYLEVTREEAEILSFALHNGALNLPARAEPAGGASEGHTWDDFVEKFFEDRLSREGVEEADEAVSGTRGEGQSGTGWGQTRGMSSSRSWGVSATCGEAASETCGRAETTTTTTTGISEAYSVSRTSSRTVAAGGEE